MLHPIYRSSCLILFLIAGSLCAGCAPSMHVLDLRDDIAQWNGPRTRPPASRRGPIKVQLVAAPTMVKIGESLLPIPASTPDNDEKVYRRLIEEHRLPPGGVLVKGLGEAARQILRSNLERYFETADVRFVPDGTPTVADVTVGHLQLAILPGFYTRTATFSWVAASPTGHTLTASATPRNANAAAHLAWALPLGILTFPVGLLIAQPIFASIYRGMEEAKTIEAIDDAAASLARQLAESDASAATLGLAR